MYSRVGNSFVRSGFRSVRSSIFMLFLISFVLVLFVRSSEISFVLRSRLLAFPRVVLLAIVSRFRFSLVRSFAERTNETERKERNFRSRSVPFFVRIKIFVPFRSEI